MSNKELIAQLRERIDPYYAMQRGTESHERKLCADALELADKRIAELSRENQAQLDELHAIAEALGTSEGHSSVHHVTELRRKLDVAREVLKGVISWSQLGTIENVASRTDICGECVPIRLTGLKACVEALAQIGGEEK